MTVKQSDAANLNSKKFFFERFDRSEIEAKNTLSGCLYIHIYHVKNVAKYIKFTCYSALLLAVALIIDVHFSCKCAF